MRPRWLASEAMEQTRAASLGQRFSRRQRESLAEAHACGRIGSGGGNRHQVAYLSSTQFPGRAGMAPRAHGNG
jgi:hypothetical protein